ncbi:MAG: S8 family serine peptidase [Deltaproteobacteria bacterium]|nr:S8 family serine peptidase [Deltaproteobacteria bacterium]
MRTASCCLFLLLISPFSQAGPRISPDLRQTPLDVDSLRLRVVSQRHRNPAQPTHGKILRQHTDSTGRSWRILQVSTRDLSGLLKELEQTEGLAWVERAIPAMPNNEKSSWLVQSGDDQLGRTLWARGLTGRGQVGAVADTGMDVDACQFRFGPEAEAITWPEDDVLPPEAHIAKPDNKVISYYVLEGADAFDEASSGFHGSHTTGTLTGDNYAHLCSGMDVGYDLHDGMAPCAQVVFQDIGSAEGYLTGLGGVSQYDMLLQAHRTGARVHNNSYGRVEVVTRYEGDSASIDEATWRLNDLLVVHSAGNSGEMDQPGTLTGLGATAKNTLVVGASGPVELDFFGSFFALQNDLLFFSSQGPTEDGRIKPDLVAPGMVFSATADKETVIDQGCCDANGNRIRVSNAEDDNCNTDEDWPSPGTSFSAPMSAGVALLLRQHFTEGHWYLGELDEQGRGRPNPERAFNPTNALLKACLLNGATPLTGIIWLHNTALGPPPSGAQGWGRIKLADALSYRDDARQIFVLADVPNPVPDNPMLAPDEPLMPFASDSSALSQGDEAEHNLPFVPEGGLLKVHLVWSDPPAEPGANPTLINDLDLEVIGPDGSRYVGNLGFDAGGESQPSTDGATDSINNVEGLIIRSPQAGRYKVRVKAKNVPGVAGLEGSTSQGYALVASAPFSQPKTLSAEPASLAPGEQLAEIRITGDHFTEGPDLRVDAGPSLSIEEVEYVDAQTLLLKQVQVSEEAITGPVDISVCVRGKLCGTGEALILIETGGCACDNAQGTSSFWLGLFFLLLALKRMGD